MIKNLLTSLTAAACLGLPSTAAYAGGLPEGDVITAEILPGWETPRGTQMAALRLTLAPGWKTYWRAPGDAGIPPRFDWGASQNIAAAELHWPRPEVFYQNGMRSIGYKHAVVLPIELTPRNAAEDIEIDATVELGVCLDICMPVELELRASLPGPVDEGPIRSALDARPMPADKAGVGKVSCSAEPIDDGLRLTADIPVRSLGTDEVAVVELADPGIWISDAAVSRQGNMLRAVADLVPEDARPFALDRSTVRITLIAGGTAIDIQGCSGN